MSAELDVGGIGVMVGLYGIFLAVGWWASRPERKAGSHHQDVSEFLVAGRSMPLWIAIMTMTATWIDGGYLLGTAEYTYRFSLPVGLQGGVCFGVSLILGGIFFARRMRREGFTTMIDLFEKKFGKRWSAILALPALLGEIFWSGALLVSLGATMSVLINIDMRTATLLAAGIVTLYTLLGGMWSVAYTDVVQLLMIPIGIILALVYASQHVGGLESAVLSYWESRSHGVPGWQGFFSGDPGRILPSDVAWWDMTLMLVFGGIPWNCYFQRVLSCRTPEDAKSHSILAGVITLLMTIPPCLLGIVALASVGPDGIKPASLTLPYVLKNMTPYPIMLLGLAAIIGAVTSSFSASILSAGSIFSWNIVHRLILPGISARRLQSMVRLSIGILGVLSAWLALRVQSVAALWLFTGDLVFVLLFPQLVLALFDPKVNLPGSMAGFVVSLALRIAGGLSLETDQGVIGFAAQPYFNSMVTTMMGNHGESWVDGVGANQWFVRTFAALCGLATIWCVSRVSRRLAVQMTVLQSSTQT